jgi:hypothetical protein
MGSAIGWGETTRQIRLPPPDAVNLARISPDANVFGRGLKKAVTFLKKSNQKTFAPLRACVPPAAAHDGNQSFFASFCSQKAGLAALICRARDFWPQMIYVSYIQITGARPWPRQTKTPHRQGHG